MVTPYSMNGTYEFYMDLSNGNKETMSAFARDVLEPRLKALPEVRDVDLIGLLEKEIVIELKKEKLDELNIDAAQVVQTIQQSNAESTIGTLTGEQNEPKLRWNTTVETMEDLENITIQTMDGLIHLKEVAEVNEQPSEQTAGVWKNGTDDFIVVQIARTADVTQVEMASAVREEVEQIRTDGLIQDFELEEIVAQVDYVSDSINGVSENVLIGGVLALIILLLFLRNFRATIIIGLSIPISILLTFSAMWYFDYSFNMLSLVALGLGIGMMVDASIVILESIFRKKEQSVANQEAVVQGIKEVATAVIASMLTTVVVFLPIGLLGGEAGKFMIILAVVIIITLVSSVLVSFTLIPTLAENFLRVSEKAKQKKEGVVVSKYGRVLKWMTKKKRNRYSMIILFFLVFAGSLSLITKVPMTIMPDVFNRYAEIAVQLESGVTPSERERLPLRLVSKWMR
ncbi:hypothetical protein JCM9140_1473 [Halalkalibacter wakoensis JCM 9140]|uniref:Acriflavin resistance protein n=1 Tax=Halalkalibacter wakoensis JCM 9140 TaxID=1236970 RepID=W4Q0L2_9BACI|nr:efflux RND transporter permease subunit [Halalkalibacter wakoensis]GAE25475.1 hypothetical protein JCM9140_1473 [Halalkalibacter wakoensis JCM 9140]